MDELSDPQIRFTLKELLNIASGRSASNISDLRQPSAIAEHFPYPFFALVGQREMKLALLLNLVNPGIGGVLLIGSRGTGKTTAVRALQTLLPQEPRSLCYYGCTEQEVEQGGMDAVCPACAKKYGQGEPLTALARVSLVELPLNAQLADVLGGRELETGGQPYTLRSGLLHQADRNILYIDEVNLLPQDLIDSILDAAAQGFYQVRRHHTSATFNSRFILIGSMNPEEGALRPQILDRFGMRVFVRGLKNPQDRLQAYTDAASYYLNPREFTSRWQHTVEIAQTEIAIARDRVRRVSLPNSLAQQAISTISQLGVESLRAEISWFESAKALAACDERLEVTAQDLRDTANICLRLRRSPFIQNYFANQQSEEDELAGALSAL